jgi:hypothetical protein
MSLVHGHLGKTLVHYAGKAFVVQIFNESFGCQIDVTDLLPNDGKTNTYRLICGQNKRVELVSIFSNGNLVTKFEWNEEYDSVREGAKFIDLKTDERFNIAYGAFRLAIFHLPPEKAPNYSKTFTQAKGMTVINYGALKAIFHANPDSNEYESFSLIKKGEESKPTHILLFSKNSAPTLISAVIDSSNKISGRVEARQFSMEQPNQFTKHSPELFLLQEMLPKSAELLKRIDNNNSKIKTDSIRQRLGAFMESVGIKTKAASLAV